MSKKAFVSGCFDLLHSGHVAFFQEAAQYGDLYVAIGSDNNIFHLKNRPTINTQAERLYMIKSLKYVKSVFVAKGSGILDFVEELKEIKPDVFVVNEDGSTPEKKKLCQELGIEYVILRREPHQGLTARSTTALRGLSTIPEWIDLLGGAFDQPDVSGRVAGSALSISIHPTLEALSSTREAAIELWGARLPADRPEKLAKILFGYGNLPGSKAEHGSSEAIGLAFAGLTKSDYAGEYWPSAINSVQDEVALRFLDDTLHLIPLESVDSFNPKGAGISPDAARVLARATQTCWQAIMSQDVGAFGHSLTESFAVEEKFFPREVIQQVTELVEPLRERALGWRICAAGLLLVSDQPVENARRLSIRRLSD